MYGDVDYYDVIIAMQSWWKKSLTHLYRTNSTFLKRIFFLFSRRQNLNSSNNADRSKTGTMTLPRVTVSNTSFQHAEKNKSLLPLSPLANGVMVTKPMIKTETLPRQTKFVTRPQTPAFSPIQTLTNYDGKLTNYVPTHRKSSLKPIIGDKFSVQPEPSFFFPDVGNVTTWHASLPRPMKQQDHVQVRSLLLTSAKLFNAHFLIDCMNSILQLCEWDAILTPQLILSSTFSPLSMGITVKPFCLRRPVYSHLYMSVLSESLS